MIVQTSFTYLHVLTVSYCNIQLPESLGDLRCLKYLDQSYSGIKCLPIRINLLRSLLTIINLSGCYNLYLLPELHNMKNLRHLNISGCDRLAHMPNGIEELLQLQTLPMYIVSRLNNLGVLGPLNLRGELKIKHLENVHTTEEAKEANIWKKRHLTSLGLCWGNADSNLIMNPTSKGSLSWLHMGKKDVEPQPSEPNSIRAMDGKLAEEVLSCLKPHENVKSLHVLGYPGFAFPRTFSKWLLAKLSTIELINCGEILCLPAYIRSSSRLKTLRMEGMNKVEKIGLEFYGENSIVAFPSLQELQLKDFPVLEGWCGIDDDNRSIFPLLRKLSIKSCPNMSQAPIFLSLQHLSLHSCSPRILDPASKSTSLLTLVIQDFAELLSLPEKLFENNSLLASIDIISCPNLQSLPMEFQNLNSLQALTIRWCQRLSYLPKGFHKLTALKSLEITECHSISTLGEEIGGLKSLKTLSIENCSSLGFISLGLQHLTSLEHLTIMYCSNLASLPDGFQNLNALKRLTLINCPELQLLPESLKFANQLQSLQLHSCSKLGSLPEWFDNF
ncbi:putative leucine-rich repeat domain superfamily [Helianthus annuus]|nr:putative leucine-rich repeat domain superfamily [Helianthus annuus]KAJ0649952.1 putative leucine-rich repeat domain superfamily [Helianthus annuus]KAJ0653736.1 putative leucine-rich repeat domain superfamily [Helianthus annuus]KAJ0832731.1 putative leucine-rich repeat domain superfamily [Helianthus annuus]